MTAIPRHRGLAANACCALVFFVSGLLASCALPADDRPRLDGYLSQFVYLEPLEKAPPTRFRDADGKIVPLAAFRGKVVLLNIWATWCLPCAAEMPTLDRLEAELGGDRFAVVAIAINRAGLPPVAAFFRRRHLTHLAIYLDPRHRTITSDADKSKPPPFPLYGLPMSYLLDARGRAIGYLKGAADWGSPQARGFLEHFIGEAKRSR